MIVRLRNHLYDKQFLNISRSSSFVISIGNLTWGGTGKTALTIELGGWLQSFGYSVAVLSRGYGRRSAGVVLVSDGQQVLSDWKRAGDEPLLIANSLPGVKVMVAADRAKAFAALESDPADVILLDDAFQHRSVARNLDLLLIDSAEDITAQKLIPFGKLREPLESISRADAVVLTHASQAHQRTISFITDHVRLPVFRGHYEPWNVGEIAHRKVAAFCAIGAPHHFIELLKSCGASVVYQKIFRDHHAYTVEDLQQLQHQAQNAGAEVLVTTEKDRIKLEDAWIHLPLAVLRVRMKIEEANFFDFILDEIRKDVTSRKQA